MRANHLLPGVVLVLCLAACGQVETEDERPGRDGSTAAALVVLRQWDDARARAWARADITALRSLYLPDSVAMERDLAMLLRWRARSLRVEHMQTQVLALRVLAESPDRLELVVTDRLARAVAAGLGQQRAVLPADGVTTRRVTLRRVGEVWRMASVLPASDQP